MKASETMRAIADGLATQMQDLQARARRAEENSRSLAALARYCTLALPEASAAANEAQSLGRAAHDAEGEASRVTGLIARLRKDADRLEALGY